MEKGVQNLDDFVDIIYGWSMMIRDTDDDGCPLSQSQMKRRDALIFPYQKRLSSRAILPARVDGLLIGRICKTVSRGKVGWI